LFSRALDQFSASNRVESLQEFQQNFPDSPWGRRAETIVRTARELADRKEQLAAKGQAETLLQQKLDGLRQENQQLTEQLEQLKGLLIQLENRPK
jgi:predicted nuclease with TOPRIM domain